MTASARRLTALLGPVLVGTAIGVNESSTDGAGPLVLGVFAGLGVGVTLLAFVRDDGSLNDVAGVAGVTVAGAGGQ